MNNENGAAGSCGKEELERRFSSAEVARRYGVSVATVQRWVRTGRLEAINLSGGVCGPYCFTREALESFEARGRR